MSFPRTIRHASLVRLPNAPICRLIPRGRLLVEKHGPFRYTLTMVAAKRGTVLPSNETGRRRVVAEWSDRYSYTEANVRTHAPASGGVYRLIHRDGTEYYVFYIGQSEDLENRLLEHLGQSELNECIRWYLRDYTCYFRFFKVSTENERLAHRARANRGIQAGLQRLADTLVRSVHKYVTQRDMHGLPARVYAASKGHPMEDVAWPWLWELKSITRIACL